MDLYRSVLDIDDGMIKAGVIGWALIAPAVAIVAVLSGRRGSVALGAGVGIGHLGMVLFMLARDDGAQGLLAGFGVVYEGLHNASVAGAVVLTGLALALTGNDVPAPTTAIGTAGTASPGWAADPFGRHQHRYWDGGQWTSMVSDGDPGPARNHGAARPPLSTRAPEPAHGVVLHPVWTTPRRPAVSLAPHSYPIHVEL